MEHLQCSRLQFLHFTVEDKNEPPAGIHLEHNVVTEYSPGVSAVRSGTRIGDLRATDPDFEDDHTFEVQAGDCVFVTKDAEGTSTLRVSNTSCFDHETQPELYVRVQVTDKGNETQTDWLKIVVSDTDDVPEGVNLSAQTVMEHSPVGTVVGSVAAIDPDKRDKHYFTQLTGLPYVQLEGT